MNFFGMILPLLKKQNLSVQDGVVIRSDLNYKPMTEAEFKEISAYNQSHPVTFVDRDFGGRQVWIET